MKVLIIDDDADVLEVVSLCFEIRWPDTTILTACDGKSGIETFTKEGADLVVLDLGLPDMDGMEVCAKLREIGDALIVMLTVRDQPTDIVRGLEAGADDYITKPFNHLEFMARANALLRRSHSALDAPVKTFADGELAINFAQRGVRIRGEEIKLTRTEYNLLYQLVANEGKLMTHQELLGTVWGQEYMGAIEYLKVHIQHLRRKLGDNSSVPKFIATERGVGYRFIGNGSS